MSDSLSNLLSAMLGAIVGGVLTLAGSVLVNRWDLRRAARLRLYDELIPQSKESFLHLTSDLDIAAREEGLERNMEAMWRTSVVAGRKERQVANAIREAWTSLAYGKPQLVELALDPTPDALEEFHNQELELKAIIERKLYELENLLERRLK